MVPGSLSAWSAYHEEVEDVSPTLSVYGLPIPADVQTLDCFRRWVGSQGEDGPHLSFVAGQVNVEVSPQNHRTHGPLAAEINYVLTRLAREQGLGRYFVPPSWLTCVEAQLSTEPDGFLVRWERLERGRVRINPERETELLGSPDMAVEVLSKTSEQKDLQTLVRGYAEAGVGEYWIVGGRGEAPELRILVLDASGAYRAQEAEAGVRGGSTHPPTSAPFSSSAVPTEAGCRSSRCACAL